jgi:hypothetical protein
MGRLSQYFFGRLDQAEFGKIQVWDFGWRSLRREYARLFFLRAVVAHPVKAALGIRRYREFIHGKKGRNLVPARLVSLPDEAVFFERASARRPGPLIGLGFCLKPFDPDKPSASCPSGRPNHDCLFLERGEEAPVCEGCDIHDIGRRALEAGCPVYIMTSAADIARDFMLPQINRGLFPAAALVLCPYSIEAIVLPLLICGVDMLLLSYAGGSCADYEQWLKADRGIKKERTTIDAESRKRLLGVLRELGAGRGDEILSRGPRRFRRAGNIHYPDLPQ